jgi:hypothetical protein
MDAARAKCETVRVNVDAALERLEAQKQDATTLEMLSTMSVEVAAAESHGDALYAGARGVLRGDTRCMFVSAEDLAAKLLAALQPVVLVLTDASAPAVRADVDRHAQLARVRRADTMNAAALSPALDDAILLVNWESVSHSITRTFFSAWRHGELTQVADLSDAHDRALRCLDVLEWSTASAGTFGGVVKLLHVAIVASWEDVVVRLVALLRRSRVGIVRSRG